VTLPRLIVLTDRHAARRPLPEVIDAAVRGGARAVVLREKDLPAPARADLAAALREVLAPVGGQLILAGLSVPASAAHLAAADPLPAVRPALLGRSCHTAAEVARAGVEGLDYVTVSPMYPTASKPGYGPALGPAGLRALAGVSPAAPPIFALGGVTPDNAPACLAAGAAGVAVMGAVMRAARPDRCVADLLHALGTGEAPQPTGDMPIVVPERRC
jgi:thiamine-phosphate pyrophosphorylase